MRQAQLASFAFTAAALLALPVLAGCESDGNSGAASATTVITFPGSAVGAEAIVLRRQIDEFMRSHPSIRVVQRRTPDAADQRHQLYVQWLNARASDPDILQLDVIWTPEFAAAGWILPLDGFSPDMDAFFPATVAANRWNDTLYALPWFVDVGMLYWRTDLFASPPQTLAELSAQERRATRQLGLPYGMVWQGARYEGLVTTFLEYLGGMGGRILDADGNVVVDSNAAIRALNRMRDDIYVDSVVPPTVLTWHEEETRFAFQNGRAAFMRNWPYAYALMEDSAQSTVAGRFAVAPMPGGPGGSPTAALGGSQLAINAHTEYPAAAYALIDYLTRPAQMLERARVAGQFPTRPALYGDSALAAALPIPAAQVKAIIERAVPRPVTPVYTQFSEILQIHLHRALTRQEEPADALRAAARAMCDLLKRVDLDAPNR